MQRLTKLALVVALVAAPFAANARSGYLSTFNSEYGTSNTALDTCDTCHGASTSSWNAYGQDLMKAGNITAGTQVTSSVITSALTAIEPNDSDGDRYTN